MLFLIKLDWEYDKVSYLHTEHTNQNSGEADSLTELQLAAMRQRPVSASPFYSVENRSMGPHYVYDQAVHKNERVGPTQLKCHFNGFAPSWQNCQVFAISPVTEIIHSSHPGRSKWEDGEKTWNYSLLAHPLLTVENSNPLVITG